MYRGNCLRMHAYVDRDRLSRQEVLLSSSTNRTFWGNTCFRHMHDSCQYNTMYCVPWPSRFTVSRSRCAVAMFLTKSLSLFNDHF